jgi:hypothetical protein
MQWIIGEVNDLTIDDAAPVWQVVIEDEDGDTIATAYGSTVAEAQSRANMIVAAPDLLAACEAAYDWIAQFGEHAPIVFGREDDLAEQLLAAISCARQF